MTKMASSTCKAQKKRQPFANSPISRFSAASCRTSARSDCVAQFLADDKTYDQNSYLTVLPLVGRTPFYSTLDWL